MPEGGFGEVLANAIAAIPDMAAALYPEQGSTLDRKMTQGAAELASALFGGSNAYVAYGEGQKAIEIEAIAPAVEAVHIEAPQQQQERGGMER